MTTKKSVIVCSKMCYLSPSSRPTEILATVDVTEDFSVFEACETLPRVSYDYISCLEFVLFRKRNNFILKYGEEQLAEDNF